MTQPTWTYPEDAAPAAQGAVVEIGRGSLPFALVHGEPLVAAAAWALQAAGVTPVDFATPWSSLVEDELPLVLHDPLCPMTPVGFLRECVATAVERDVVVVAVRPVTDTVKTVRDDALGHTLDRTELWSVTSPIVLPAGVVASLAGLASTDFAELALDLAARYPMHTMVAPAEGRRVASVADVEVLEAQTAR